MWTSFGRTDVVIVVHSSFENQIPLAPGVALTPLEKIFKQKVGEYFCFDFGFDHKQISRIRTFEFTKRSNLSQTFEWLSYPRAPNAQKVMMLDFSALPRRVHTADFKAIHKS